MDKKFTLVEYLQTLASSDVQLINCKERAKLKSTVWFGWMFA